MDANSLKEVYIVTSDEYDDYEIRGVFTTRKRAENYIKLLQKKERRTNRIETWKVNHRYRKPYWD